MPRLERDAEIYRRHMDNGETMADIGQSYGITRSRVQQIVKAYGRKHGLPPAKRCLRCNQPVYRYATCRTCRHRLNRARVQRLQNRKEEHHLIGIEAVAEALETDRSNVNYLLAHHILRPCQGRAFRGRLVFARSDIETLQQAGYGDKEMDPYKNRRLPGTPCPTCGLKFVGGRPDRIYCSRKCRQAAINKRHYEKNREQVIAAVIERRKTHKQD